MRRIRAKAQKRFNPDDLLRSRLFKDILRRAYDDWEPDDIKHLQERLAYDPGYEDLVVEFMTNLKWKVRSDRGTLSRRDIRSRLKNPNQLFQARLLGQREALHEFHPRELLESDFISTR